MAAIPRTPSHPGGVRAHPASPVGLKPALGALLLAGVIAALGSVPASASGPANLSVSVLSTSAPVKSVTLNIGNDSYTNCTGGNSTGTAIGYPNGHCTGTSPVQITNGSAAATILVNGADMVPSNNGTHWTLCGASGGPACTGSLPGLDQYSEAISSSLSGVPLQLLGNTTVCDTIFDSACTGSGPNVQQTEYLAITGPSSSSESAGLTWTSTITWTAS
jgi:hypothetical protein